jgi:hypothetical protein
LVSASDLLREEKDEGELSSDLSDIEAFDNELFDKEVFDCEKEFTANDGIKTRIKAIDIMEKLILTVITIISLMYYCKYKVDCFRLYLTL